VPLWLDPTERRRACPLRWPATHEVTIKAVKTSAPCAASPRTSSNLALPTVVGIAQTTAMVDRADAAPVAPPMSSKPVFSESVRDAEITTISAKWYHSSIRTRGRPMDTQVPSPLVLSTTRRPPIHSMIRFDTVRPRPLPWCDRVLPSLSWEKASKILV